jgi:hypothetical protein
MSFMYCRRFILAPLAALFLLAACEDKKQPAAPPPEDGFYLRAAGFDALPGWARDDHAAALDTLRVSCVRIEKRPAEAPFFRAGRLCRQHEGLAGALPDAAAGRRRCACVF